MCGEVKTGETLLAVFSSLNQVALVKRKLYQDGIYAEMTRVPQCLSYTGCRFALRCNRHQLRLIRRACAAAGITLGGPFREIIVGGVPSYRTDDDRGLE